MLGAAPGEKPPLQLSDTLAVIPYRGQEYIIPPGAEGVASLVFDVPKSAKSVKGGSREDDDGRTSEALFEVRCIVGVKLNMGLGRCDSYSNTATNEFASTVGLTARTST